MERIPLGQDRNTWRVLVNMSMKHFGSIKGVELVGYVNDC
jgi:hypothetical protein